MFQTSKRHVTRPRGNAPPSSSSLINNKKGYLIKLSTTNIIIIIVMALIVFSLYLSTKIIPSNQEYIANNPSINSIDIDPPVPISEDSEESSKVSSNEWETALQKSLKLYINRAGHIDRVEYLIGFRGTRITDSTQYRTLQTRNTKKYDRDYRTSPVSIRGWGPQPQTETKCDALCTKYCRLNKCDVSGIDWSMENIEIHERDDYITGNTKLSSLVPVPYFSWHDFEFMLPIKEKNADGLAAAFISNCGFKKRNNMVRDLQKYGVSVHSYGHCQHNKDEVKSADGNRGNKIEILQRYKFSLAFENSETDDYITEKYFGSLQSGSVPVYIGANNVKFFAPDFGVFGAGKPWKSQAVIWAGDYEFNAERLAKYLLYLDSNDTAYNEYLQWKIDGYSGDFKAMVDLTAATHTSCRQCILAIDWQRYHYGIGAYDEIVNNEFERKDIDVHDDNKWFYVRERGMYRFTLIRCSKTNALKSLIKSVLISIEPKPVNFWNNNKHPNYSIIGPAVYAIYHIPTKHVIHSDIAIQNLPNYVELEVIFV